MQKPSASTCGTFCKKRKETEKKVDYLCFIVFKRNQILFIGVPSLWAVIRERSKGLNFNQDITGCNILYTCDENLYIYLYIYNMQIHLRVIECNKIRHHSSTDAVFRPLINTTGTLKCCPMFVYKKLQLNKQKNTIQVLHNTFDLLLNYISNTMWSCNLTQSKQLFMIN